MKKKNFKSASHQKKKVQFFESNFKNINFKSLRQVPFFESWEKSILWEFFFKKNQFFKSNENMSYMQKKKKVFDSLSRIEKKRFDSLTLSRIYLTKIQFFESYSKRGSILWVTFEKRVQFFESHLSKEGSILWVTFRKGKVQFFESFWEKRFYSLNHKKGQFFASDLEKSSILCVVLKKRVRFFE